MLVEVDAAVAVDGDAHDPDVLDVDRRARPTVATSHAHVLVTLDVLDAADGQTTRRGLGHAPRS